ncbi:tetratricopeptide repeat protein [Aurantibacter aestuarii]|uniref:Aerotolerance regulator BatC n=1 Tax=Aurantibacter aestuarii TaxID=1266046 RepID=A0A2T1NDL0_9FLAO|nr:tetratricopeptide repeat protein [Aurantibacter aestuarii]PSG90510.1 aerotolerance regulator BatC [Aurantibacter aestuarii]
MKDFFLYICIAFSTLSWSQNEDKTLQKKEEKATQLIVSANDKISSNQFIEAEMDYRKAISSKPSSVAGTYNLAHSYYKNENFEEALYRNQQAAKNAVDKDEKHKAFHNIGNILMKEKKCKEAVEAYKNALRNNPKDDETRYNFALAKECAKQQEDDKPQEENKDGENNKDKEKNEDKDKKENNEKEKEQDQKDQNQKDKGDENKDQENKDKDDQGKPKDEKKDAGKGDEDKKQQQPQKGQLSPQQIKNLLEAMNNQEKKVQEKVNAQQAKGVKVQTDKDW